MGNLHTYIRLTSTGDSFLLHSTAIFTCGAASGSDIDCGSSAADEYTYSYTSTNRDADCHTPTDKYTYLYTLAYRNAHCRAATYRHANPAGCCGPGQYGDCVAYGHTLCDTVAAGDSARNRRRTASCIRPVVQSGAVAWVGRAGRVFPAPLVCGAQVGRL